MHAIVVSISIFLLWLLWLYYFQVLYYDTRQNIVCRASHKLVIVAIFKNESLAMREWLQHYVEQGVTHFYLIDNGSTDDWRSQISGYPVTVRSDTRKNLQKVHYNEYYLEEVKTEADWVMIVDLDEFLYARTTPTIPDFLDSLPDNVGSVRVQWKMFGSSGHQSQPASIRDGFTQRLDYDKPVKAAFNHLKSICRTRGLMRIGVHTSRHYGRNLYLRIASEADLRVMPLHLNHYAIQSWDFYKNVKMTRGDVASKLYSNVRDEKYFKKYDVNEIEDKELVTS